MYAYMYVSMYMYIYIYIYIYTKMYVNIHDAAEGIGAGRRRDSQVPSTLILTPYTCVDGHIDGQIHARGLGCRAPLRSSGPLHTVQRNLNSLYGGCRICFTAASLNA